MKNKLTKLISSILLVAFLVSAFAIFASAEPALIEEEEAELSLLLHRTFSEGWDYTNGLTPSGNTVDNKLYIDYERTSNDDYNYFLRFMAMGAEAANVTFDFSVGDNIPSAGGTVIKLSFKADDSANISGNENISADVLTGTSNLDESLKFLTMQNGHLYAYNDKSGSERTDLGALSNKWMNIAFVFDWDKGGMFYTLYYGENYSKSMTVSYKYNTNGDVGIKKLLLGFPATTSAVAAAERYGTGFCLDNLAIYNQSKRILTVDELVALGTGKSFDTYLPKTIEILSSTGMTVSQSLEESLCMKLGVDYALFKNERIAIFEKNGVAYGAPEKVNGTVMVPLQLILDYIGFPSYVHADGMSYDITTGTSKTNIVAGRDSASVNGERFPLTVAPGFVGEGDGKYLVIALDDVETLFPGWLVTYDDMGLIIVYPDTTPDNQDDNADLVNRDEHLELMVDIMKKFVFTTITEDQNGEPLKAADAYNATGAAIYNDVKANTNNFTHPYIGANQASFDKLYSVYMASLGSEAYNAVAKAYLEKLVAKADEFYSEVADVREDGSYIGIKDSKVPVNVYKDGKNPDAATPDAVEDTSDGYSPDGRLTEIVDYAERILDLAFAYQVTRNEEYAKLAYDFAIALGQWEHWGPGYMSDCAEATYAYSVAYDWLYNAFYSLHGQNGVEAVARIIFEKGVHDGFVASNGRECEHPRNLGDESAYSTLTTNINAVGSVGMMAGALAIMEFDTLAGSSSVESEVKYVLGNNLIGLINNGLDVYAPDGSYIESATNWAKGTNSLFRLIMSLQSAAGSDYGLVDTWGIDKTCYYAVHIESSDGKIWNYNEGGADGVITGALASSDTQMFNFAAQLFGDSALATIRDKQLSAAINPKEVTIYDMLFFPFDGVEEMEELPLDYEMDGLDAFVSRSDWENGAMYTGLMGGENTANYSQYDSGNFIYYNEGIAWFMDLGSDNHAAYQYLGASRYKYYRANAEGQNIVLIKDSESIPDGQYSGGAGKIVKSLVNEHGSYAIIDNASVYPGAAVTAYRGIFVTNDRRTVVIQDEINFGTQVQSLAWVAHTAQNIVIDETGRTAYLTSMDASGKMYTLRASIVSKNKKVSFTVQDSNSFYLPNITFAADGSTGRGGAPEYSRDGIKKLVIEYNDAVNFNVAVVLEMVESRNNTTPVGYEWTELSAWVPYADGTVGGNANSAIREGVNVSDIRTRTKEAKSYFDNDTAFTDKLAEFYLALAQVEYTIDFLDNVIADEYHSDANKYMDLSDQYEAFREVANVVINNAYDFADRLVGTNEQVIEEPAEDPTE